MFCAVCLSFIFYKFNENILIKLKLNTNYRSIFIFFNRKFFFDYIYNFFIFNKLIKNLVKIYYFLDKGVLEWVGPTGAFYITYKLNNKISTIQTGIIYYYI
jgi:NADH:ubiquinone oxidoreductase subunit 5 (subunit L)/multisubunit Na+/H+ antiporter MnhA subunit